MRAGLASVNIWGQEPLAVEVKSHGTAGKRLILPAAAVIMTPPVDVAEGLVVEEAAEVYLGALSFVIFTTHIVPLGFIIVRRICFSLKLGDEGCCGVADGGEYGGVGRFGIHSIL
ncbi:aminotransferase class I/II-fold pyridoxal phosphate-dependent enzyme [Babesia caballi]|uniref:Aminotransferase class I/II-fold pyridoxal phosphate-dependent enzyme n=1 Tax=Babesia caballi TaxID=5871 RepID=A0AAV4M139_BABCB|nr:aminotransferase class I/II-fold pyridoxal phosphate-dependent enzyme [Babesia caballi]